MNRIYITILSDTYSPVNNAFSPIRTIIFCYISQPFNGNKNTCTEFVSAQAFYQIVSRKLDIYPNAAPVATAAVLHLHGSK